MKVISFIFLTLFCLSIHAQEDIYFPDRNVWEKKSASSFGFNQQRLDQAIDSIIANEYVGPVDLRQAILKGFEREPYHKILGPTKRRGGPAGMILKDGYIIAQWGDTKKVDMTFSVTKSYLSTVAGLAVDRGMIRSVDDKVSEYVWEDHFTGSHNAKITWAHLLNQSSAWSGQLWGGYDWNDRPPRDGDVHEWRKAALAEPGTEMEYNDVRVNLLAYSLLQVWRQPLPQVLKEKILDPIGASTTWRWFGYDNSWTTVDGVSMQSVSGGGHSGGGIFINTEDHARFGLLCMNKGKWKDQQIISEEWLQAATTPSTPNPNYGYMWWLNKNGGENRMNALSNKGFYAAGFGGNYIIVEPEDNIVIVLRWCDPSSANRMLGMIKEAMN
jgi:CubicO group peptidase (beta-lactamase class C family)